MKEIPLTKGQVVVVDDEDYEYLSQFNWYYNGEYAVRNVTIAPKKRKTVFMHRIIMNTPDGMETDHIDGNKLNNTRSNLRVCSKSENQWNKQARTGKSKYKGVYWYRSDRHRTGKWFSRIQVDKKLIRLGYFLIEEDAARAYNEAAIKYHGEFAQLNIIDEVIDMRMNEYQALASRTAPKNVKLETKLTNFAMGLAGETGETVDYLKKVIFHNHELDREHIKKELGDILWYVSQMANALKIDLSDVAELNIAKLKARYPEGFKSEDSINRVE